MTDWFNQNLRVPPRFSRSRKKYAENKAICWFQESATVCIACAEEMARILQANHFRTFRLTTRKPGYVVYEDGEQVAAIPFRDSIRIDRWWEHARMGR